MPEGDTIYKTARTLRRALTGQRVAGFRTELVKLARVDDEAPLAGRTIEDVSSAGKHLLMTFSGDLVLRTHMRMNGSWHIYRPGERWQRPASDMRIVIETAGWVAVAFLVHEAEFVRASELARHRPVATLGPDLLAPHFDADEALRRMRARSHEAIADVLLNQQALAGIGNIYKSETLFLARVHPDTPIARLDDETLRNVMAIARGLLQENVAERPGPTIVTYREFRNTTRRMRPEDRFWVYGRWGRPCRKCGTPVASEKRGEAARVTYWCPTCQPDVTRSG